MAEDDVHKILQALVDKAERDQVGDQAKELVGIRVALEGLRERVDREVENLRDTVRRYKEVQDTDQQHVLSIITGRLNRLEDSTGSLDTQNGLVHIAPKLVAKMCDDVERLEAIDLRFAQEMAVEIKRLDDALSAGRLARLKQLSGWLATLLLAAVGAIWELWLRKP